MNASSPPPKVLPPEGIKVIQVLQHAHLLGKALTLRHIRGHRELPIIAQGQHVLVSFCQVGVLQG